jgi:hypothetical protein
MERSHVLGRWFRELAHVLLQSTSRSSISILVQFLDRQITFPTSVTRIVVLYHMIICNDLQSVPGRATRLAMGYHNLDSHLNALADMAYVQHDS